MVAVIRELKASDAGIAEVRTRLVSGVCPDVLAASLVAGLAASGTPAAQGVLLAVLSDHAQPESRRAMVLFALVELKEPLPALDKALMKLSEESGELADSAFFVLASLGDQVRKSDPDRFGQIRGGVIAALESSRLVDDIERALFAVGNLGLDELHPRVRECADHTSARIRAAAMHALSTTRSPGADRILARVLLEDEDRDVRLAARRGLQERNRQDLLHASALPLPLDELLGDSA
jgi:hypothetical protein